MTVIPVKGRHARADTVTVTRTTHTLPFDKLSPRDFERLCLWLLEREGYQRARVHARSAIRLAAAVRSW
jgi:restriction endonuclease Mrr